MSTRATIIVENSKNERKQYYHHTDGYPEYMGCCLGSFLGTAECLFSTCEEVEKKFLSLLEEEGHFELEELGDVHIDIEYIWYVKLSERGESDTVSYTEINSSHGWGEELSNEISELLKKNVGETVVKEF